jgi:hypothetical protein
LHDLKNSSSQGTKEEVKESGGSSLKTIHKSSSLATMHSSQASSPGSSSFKQTVSPE